MPTYVLLSTLTPEGRQTLHKDPDRLEAVNQEIAVNIVTLPAIPVAALRAKLKGPKQMGKAS